MELSLLELKRYAIERRIEIKFANPGSGQECLIDGKGVMRIPQQDKDMRVEEVLAAAQFFDVTDAESKPQRLSREQLAAALKDRARGRGAGGSHADEDD